MEKSIKKLPVKVENSFYEVHQLNNMIFDESSNIIFQKEDENKSLNNILNRFYKNYFLIKNKRIKPREKSQKLNFKKCKISAKKKISIR